ncbi:PAS domain-containing protein [Natronobeatus ordinarius]|uniref:PAS domain-containing protein n=1 Tax=Natronobeatus ordinarius TaxID=2963433 RepID=UPI0020CF7357|nr:PAS domain-containing protein [Natronobeatus ordinarius]
MTSSDEATGRHRLPRQQAVSADLGRRALELDDLEQLLSETAVAVGEPLGVEYVSILDGSRGDDALLLREGVGWRDGLVGSAKVPATGDSVAGHVIRTGEPVVVEDLGGEERLSGSDLLTSHGVVSGISVPIGLRETPWGVLGAYTSTPRAFDDHAVDFLRSVANVLAMAIERDRSQPTLEELHGRISDAFYSLDENWRFTYLNERAEELIDVTDEGLVGKHVWETFEWAAGSMLKVEYERAMDTQEPTSFELYYPEPLESWYEINAYPSETGLSVYFRDVTERKEREAVHAAAMEELRESEERLRLALEAGEMGTWELDLQTEDSPVRSPRHDRIFGYEEPLEDWGFETFLEHVHPEDREEVKRRFETAFETGTWEFECRIVRADGERRVIAAQGEFYFDDGGEPTRAVGVVRDVTDRYERERHLEDANARLEAATEAGAIGTWEWEIPEDRMTVGASFADQFGIDPDEAREGVSLERFFPSIHDADRDRVRRAVEEAVDSCGEYEAEYRVWNDDDELRWVLARGHVECADDGTPESFPGVLIDITERRTAQEALRESEAKFRMVAENLDEIVWIMTADAAAYLYISPSFDEIWGVSRQRLYDDPESYTQFVHPDDRERVSERFSRLPDVEFDEAFRVVRPDGEPRWLDVRGERVENDDGVAHVIGIGQDVTERVEYEQKLEESNERLEQFAYAASHDLQEPLRMVTSYLQLLERRYVDELDSDGREFVEFAVDGAERMREMIDGLLAYSRVETQGEPFEPVDLDAVLDDVRADLRLQIEESDAKITAEALPRVSGDDGQLRQVFQNLLANAIEYSGDEPPRIHVSATRDGPNWRLSVRDEGTGIDPSDADRVFEVFQRLHSHEEHEGTGLGLALCKRIVERHGGEIRVDAERGDGSTFSFTIPSAE